MTSKVWLLVEWVEENNLFTSYGVVNYDSVVYNETNLEPGNIVYVRVISQENPRRAKILRISESKLYIKEHKEILERQDQQFKSVLQLCMQTIQQMKANNSSVPYNPQLASNQIAPPHVIIASNSHGARNSLIEGELNNRTQESNRIQGFNSFTPKYNRREPIVNPVRGLVNVAQQRAERPLHSSTPLPTSNARAQQNVTLCFDQGSQTEEQLFETPIAKIEELEAVLRTLYKKFQNIVAEVTKNVENFQLVTLSEIEDNHDVSSTETNNEYSTEHNDTNDEEGSAEIVKDVQNAGAAHLIEGDDVNQPPNNSNAIAEDLTNPNALRVRRMSAQTTNNIEVPQSQDADMVAIGKGNAKVPKRLLYDIDWNSHTTATRQLLQAVFPRSVLATHCLTGKQSPAFMNRPAKKILDQKLVEDIVKIVSTRCGVPKNLVRNSITIKCTDEAKLYRNRQMFKQQRKKVPNDENRPPSSLSSESSNTLIN